jgi:Flp pilus assembly protein TadD
MTPMVDTDRTAELHARLMDTRDELERARIHLELGRLALADGRLELAVRHLREALVLDQRLEQARRLLQDLGAASRVQISKAGGRRQAMRALLGKFRGR